jgi:antibiotic biosynthesis monooxygenase (ABM) superfamily enzyme
MRNGTPGGRPVPIQQPMIARIWHGWTKPGDANAYEKLLRDEIFPSIAAQKIIGYRGAELFARDDGDEVEFITLLRFDSMDAVTEFAGAEASKPVIFPKAEALITRMEQARHYRLAISLVLMLLLIID